MATGLKRGVLLALLTLVAASAQATWYSENIESGADIMMMDLRWPWWPSGTYYANWNTSFNPKPNDLSFYAGFVATVPDGPEQMPNPDERVQQAFRPGTVWSFWGSSADGTPVSFVDCAPNLFLLNRYGGEGCSGSMGAEGWPFVKCRRWYTMLARVWPVDDTTAYVGRWIKDLADGRWHLIAFARLPIAATSFAGNSGFIEPLSGEKVVRPLDRRLGYFRKDGAWRGSDTIAIDKTQYVVVNTLPEGDHEYVGIEYSHRPDLMPRALTGQPLDGGKRYEFRVKQPAVPTLDRPAVTGVTAESNGAQVAVAWQVPETAAPMLGYRVEVFDNAACAGQPKAVRAERLPTARWALLDAAVPRATVRLTVTDVFDQAAPPVVLPARPSAPPLPATATGASRPGLAYELRQSDASRRVNYFYDALERPAEEHIWLSLAEAAQGKLQRAGLARGFDLSVREQRTYGYALSFTGRLRAPATGLYLLHAQIDGGYRVTIDGREALAWDGQHGTTARSALCRLAQGDHALAVAYFVDRLPATNFSLEWEGPRSPRQPIPLEALRVPDDGAYPLPTIRATAGDDGTGEAAVNVSPAGHQVNRTALYLGALELVAGDGPTVTYRGPLARGANHFWARVTYDQSHTVDSEPAALAVTGRPVDAAWTVRNVGDAKASAGLWQTGPAAFSFFGNGMHTVTQHVTGDFTATCRVDDYAGSHGEPVNRRAWVGLSARENGERLNWEWGRDFQIVQTAADGLRASPDNSDLGAGRISSYELPQGRPWLRIVRQGQVWTSWCSADGQRWELGAYHHRRMRPDLDVGLFFSALPQEARAHYRAAVSQVSIVAGTLPETAAPLPEPAHGTDGDRLTGVVSARSNAQVVVLRSSHAGLLRSTDGGATWRPANGGLAAADLAVRSVAIAPGDPLTMLRAGAGGLWRTSDGGQTWRRLDCPADFDGVGPSALCGEVVAFDLLDPRVVYVGGESRGLFKSSDGGETWSSLGLAGERITAVTVWPWEKHYPATGRGVTHLAVTTCPDRHLAVLGRGQPGTATGGKTSRGYLSHDAGRTLSVQDECDDTGFYNVAFDKATQSTSEVGYATSHGYQGNSGGFLTLFPPAKCLEWLRPSTALGAAAMGEQKFGRFITQALAPLTPGRLSRSQEWAFGWSWLPSRGTPAAGGLIACCGDETLGESWWFVHTDGLYYSADGGVTVRRVLDARGVPAP